MQGSNHKTNMGEHLRVRITCWHVKQMHCSKLMYMGNYGVRSEDLRHAMQGCDCRVCICQLFNSCSLLSCLLFLLCVPASKGQMANRFSADMCIECKTSLQEAARAAAMHYQHKAVSCQQGHALLAGLRCITGLSNLTTARCEFEMYVKPACPDPHSLVCGNRVQVRAKDCDTRAHPVER